MRSGKDWLGLGWACGIFLGQGFESRHDDKGLRYLGRNKVSQVEPDDWSSK